MEFWQHSLVITLIALSALLGIGLVVRRYLPVPASIVAGTLGLLLGPGVAGVVPFDVDALEIGVYHALAVVFIALGLRRPAELRGGRGPRAMAFGISVMVTLQTVIGLGIALLLDVHAGFGLLLPLGFEQGPGQAMALGAAWESSGLVDGAQVGLIIAAIGFGWSVFAGVPLVVLGRRRGWISPSTDETTSPEPTSTDGGLTTPLALIALVYAVTWAVCAGLASLLSGLPDVAAMVWGFHYLWGSIIAAAVRWGIDRANLSTIVDDAQLSSISGTVVEFATAAALTAVQIAVLTAFFVPILAITTVGGLLTLFGTVWLARRAFVQAPFEHAVLWFGMSTGTLPVGLSLLRMIDPELRSPVPRNAVYGSALSLVGVAPVVLGLHPLAITSSPELALGLSFAWLVGLLTVWWAFAGLGARPSRSAAGS